MKKSILSLLVATATCLSAKAQVDLSINPFVLLVPGVQVSIEYSKKPNWGFGGDALAAEGLYAIYASGKFYFNPKNGADRLYVGSFLGSAGGEGRSGYGLGFFVGYKVVSVQKLSFDVAYGIGRDFSDDIGLLPYFKANVGYRFGLKETD